MCTCTCSSALRVPLQGEEVEYSLRLLPLGGYVAFPDDDPESPYPRAPRARARSIAPLLSCAAPAPPRAPSPPRCIVAAGSPPATAAPAHPHVRCLPAWGRPPPPPLFHPSPHAADDPDLLRNRTAGDRAAVVSAGVLANFALAIAICFIQVGVAGVVPGRLAGRMSGY